MQNVERNSELEFDELQDRKRDPKKRGKAKTEDLSFDPVWEGAELAAALPVLKAQRRYVLDLINKYGGERLPFSEKAGMPQSSVYRWIKGHRIMTPTKTIAMERTLGEVTIHYPDYLKREWL